MTKVAAGFGLSDVGLKKICIKHRIPVPGRGYWQRLTAGQRVRRTALPAIGNAPEIVIRVAPSRPKSTGEDMDLDAIKAAESAYGEVVVQPDIERPHRITKAMRHELKGKKPDDYGAIHCITPDVPHVRIHPDSVDRVLRITDAFIRACEARSFELLPGKRSGRYNGQLGVAVDDETFEISIEERMRRVTHKLTEDELARRKRGLFVHARTYDYVPTGELTFKTGYGRAPGVPGSWTDTRQRKIEERLGEVLVAMRQHADWRKAERERGKRREERFQAAQQERADLRARVEAERQAVAQLEKDAADWRRAEAIRTYLATVEAGRTGGDGPFRSTEWIDWALAQADRIDPLAGNPPSILDTPEADMQPLVIWQFTRDEEQES